MTSMATLVKIAVAVFLAGVVVGCEKSSPSRATTREAAPAPAQEGARTSLPESQAARRRVHVLVAGKVQGVEFRNFSERKARELGLCGWVRNMPDGRVEFLIEGLPENVGAMLEEIRTVPAPARIERIDPEDEPPRGEFQTFEVRYQ